MKSRLRKDLFCRIAATRKPSMAKSLLLTSLLCSALALSSSAGGAEVAKAIPYLLPESARSYGQSTPPPRPTGYAAKIVGAEALDGITFFWNRGCWHSDRALLSRESHGQTAQQRLATSIRASDFPPGSTSFLNTINYLIITPPRQDLPIATQQAVERAETQRRIPHREQPPPAPPAAKAPPAETPIALAERPQGYPRIIRGSGGWPGWVFTWQNGGWKSDRVLKTRFDSNLARQRELHLWTAASSFPRKARPLVAADGYVWIVPQNAQATVEHPPIPPLQQSPPRTATPAVRSLTLAHSQSRDQPPEALTSSSPDTDTPPNTIRAALGLSGWIFKWTGTSWRSDRPLRTPYLSESDRIKDLRTWITASGFPIDSKVFLDYQGYVCVSPSEERQR